MPFGAPAGVYRYAPQPQVLGLRLNRDLILRIMFFILDSWVKLIVGYSSHCLVGLYVHAPKEVEIHGFALLIRCI